MILSSHGIIGSSIVQIPFIGLLDDYPSAAAAYSLRRLSGTYSGKAIEVRRTNNDVADIGFNGLGELDTTALLAFTGTGALDNGFVTKWYDQSGNGINATQSLAINQPQIVSSGVVLLQGSKPTLQFNGTSNFLQTILLTKILPETSFVVSKRNTSIGDQVIYGGATLAQQLAITRDTNQLRAFNGVTGDGTAAVGSMFLASFLFSNSTSDFIRYNNSDILTGLNFGNRTGATTFRIGANPGASSNYVDGTISEIVLYQSNKTSTVSNIESNINSYYAIY
jgi:hypothetical protein